MVVGVRFEVALKLVDWCRRANEAAEERNCRDTVTRKAQGHDRKRHCWKQRHAIIAGHRDGVGRWTCWRKSIKPVQFPSKSQTKSVGRRRLVIRNSSSSVAWDEVWGDVPKWLWWAGGPGGSGGSETYHFRWDVQLVVRFFAKADLDRFRNDALAKGSTQT